MKTLKVKSILFGLMTILALSVLLVSCEQDITETINDSTTNESLITASLTPPADVYDRGDDYMSEYLSNASEELIIKLHNNYIVANVLDTETALDVIKNEPYGFHYSEINLSKYLSDNEVSLIQSNFVTDISNADNNNALKCPWGQWRVCGWFNCWHCWCQ